MVLVAQQGDLTFLCILRTQGKSEVVKEKFGSDMAVKHKLTLSQGDSTDGWALFSLSSGPSCKKSFAG